MYGLDLFSGIGGITKALEGYVRPVAYCEIDPYARGVLLSRIASGELPRAPIWDDVTSLHGEMLPHIDIIYGGFPCQDISIAGKQAGLVGKRSGLFFEIMRLARETKAEWIFLENVPNIRTKGLGRVLKEMDLFGYDCRWGLLSAADVGANHKRERWFLLAHLRSERAEGCGEKEIQNFSAISRSENVRRLEDVRNRPNLLSSALCRTYHGIPFGVDRVRALGNAVVPAQAREAFERLMGFK